MPNVRGGDIRQFTIAGRELDPAPEADVTIILSGFSNASAPTGNGKLHTTQKRKLGGIKGMKVSSDNSRGDYEFVQDVADTGAPVPVNITLADGTAYSGSLVPEGDIEYSSADGSFTFDALGEKMEQI